MEAQQKFWVQGMGDVGKAGGDGCHETSRCHGLPGGGQTLGGNRWYCCRFYWIQGWGTVIELTEGLNRLGRPFQIRPESSDGWLVLFDFLKSIGDETGVDVIHGHGSRLSEILPGQVRIFFAQHRIAAF